jgi:Leucine Rich Repeat (LRR) protein
MNSSVFSLFFAQAGTQAKGQPAGPDQQKTALIEKAGGRVATIAQNDNHLEVDFHLQGGSVSDAALAAVAGLKDVVQLNLGKTSITDAGLAQIKGMTTLTRLHLEQTKVTDKGLASLKGLTSLEYLNLYGTEITDRGLEELAGLSKLKSLYVWQTKVTEAGVGKLKKALPKLEIVTGWEQKEEPKEKDPKEKK